MKPGLREPNIDRLIAAYRREKLDRVPNFEECIGQAATEHILGKKTGCDHRFLPIPDAVEMAKRTCQDAIQFQAGVWLGNPLDERPPFCSMEEIQRWEPPDPATYVSNLRAMNKAVEGTGLGVGAIVTGPFFTSYVGMGPIAIQSFLENLYLDLPFVECLLQRHTEAQLDVLEAVLDEPMDFIMIADDTCVDGGFMCRPEMLERIWVPRITRLIDLAKQKGVPIEWHCCGKLDPLMPYLIEWGIDCIQPVQPKCNDIYALHEQYGDRISFRGNMNIEQVLAFGTPEEVKADTREHIERLAGGGGYIVASSHSIVDGVPPENYLAMIEATCEYGQY